VKLFLLTLLGALIFLSDFFLKNWIQSHLPLMNVFAPYPFSGIGVFHNFMGIDFSMVHVVNTGAAWGIFSSWKYLLVVLRIVIILVLFFSNFFWSHAKANRLALMLIVVGASSNVIDFFHYGHVVDMFYFIFWGYSYPVFNIADSAIFIGALLLGLRSIRASKKLHTNLMPA